MMSSILLIKQNRKGKLDMPVFHSMVWFFGISPDVGVFIQNAGAEKSCCSVLKESDGEKVFD